MFDSILSLWLFSLAMTAVAFNMLGREKRRIRGYTGVGSAIRKDSDAVEMAKLDSV